MSKGSLSKERLSRVHDVMTRYVKRGHVPGVVGLVSRRGEVHVEALGTQSIGGEPMRRDTIFRIASMTNMWQSDPSEEMITILLSQRMFASPTDFDIFRDSMTSAYQAIDD